MAAGNIGKLEKLLKEDETARARLNELAQAYDGDRNDERALFEATFVVLAEEVGLPFTADEVANAMAEGRELDDAELNAVAGGDGFCYFIGGSDEPEVECGYMGYACAYVGVTS